MKYNGMPAGMWMLFKKQFQKALVVDLGYDLSDAKRIAKAAKPKYREIDSSGLGYITTFPIIFPQEHYFL